MAEPDKPEAGWYQMTLCKNGPDVAVEIFFGAPICPHTGEELDRSHRWQARIDGKVADDVFKAWPYCAGEPIAESEYLFLIARAEWARKWARKTSPFANPYEPVDWLFTKPV